MMLEHREHMKVVCDLTEFSAERPRSSSLKNLDFPRPDGGFVCRRSL